MNSKSRLCVCSYALVVVVLAMPRHSAAKFGHGIDRDASYLSPGLVVGGSKTNDGDLGFVGGGELTFYRFGSIGLAGATTDVIYDTYRKTGRGFVGPLVGVVLRPGVRLRLDAGYLVEFGGGEVRHGGAARLFVSVAALCGPYVAAGLMADADDFVEFGLRFKFPFSL